MYELFESQPILNVPLIVPPGFDLVRRIYQRELQTVIRYYQSRVKNLDSQHLLLRILTTGTVSHELPLDRFMDIVTARAPYIAKHFMLTADTQVGKIHPGTFYGPGVSEVLMYREEYFNPYAVADWTALRSVQVLDHPITDLEMLLPCGRRQSTAEGLAVITIDIPMLLYQFRRWTIHQVRSGMTDAPSTFIMQYILPQMLWSHLDIVISNRMIALHHGAPMSSPLFRHPFRIVKYEAKLDRMLQVVLNIFHRSKYQYLTYLANVPSITAPYPLLMPDLGQTYQVRWAEILARLKVMRWLIDLSSAHPASANRVYINHLQKDLKVITASHVLERVLPDDLRYDTISTINEILSLK
jgi:hypothetical protein